MSTRVVWDDDEQQIADLEKAMRRLRARLATTSVHGTHDEFTVAATPQTTYQLLYIPVDGTCAMFKVGTEQEEGTAYTVDYSTGIVTFVTALTTGQRINFRYLVTDWLVARSLPPDTGAARIVQTAINGKNGGGTSVTATFASAPTPGNILLWIVSRYSHRSTAPSNGGTYPFSQQFLSPSAQGDAAVDVYTRTVATGDPTVWEMDELFGTDSMTACIVEVAGSDGNPGAWFMPSTGVFASPLSQSVTGTAGQLLIVGVAPNGGSTFGGLTDITPFGYTEDAEFVPAGSSLNVGHTTATGSAQSIGASWDGTNGDCVQVVIVVPGI